MAILVSSFQDSNEQRYLYVHPLGTTYEVNLLECVRRVPSVNVSLTKIHDYAARDFTRKGLPDMLSHLISAINQDAEACKIIGKHLGWTPSGEGLQCQLNFGKWLDQKHVETWETLDLSALKIDRLPPQIGKFKGLKTLMLGENHLRYLPPEFLHLSVKILPEETPEDPHPPCQSPLPY